MILIILFIVMLFISTLFSILQTINNDTFQDEVNKLSLKDNQKAQKIYKLQDSYCSLNAVVLIADVLASVLLTVIVFYYFINRNVDNYILLSVLVCFGIIFIQKVIVRAILEKHSHKICLLFVNVLVASYILFKPFVYIFNKITDKLLFFIKPQEVIPSATDEELMTMVDEIEEEGLIDKKTGKLVRSAIDFIDVTACEIMTPRVDVYAINVDEEISNVLKSEKIFAHSRIPVYEENIDNIIGIVNTKMVLKKLLMKEEVNLKEMLYNPIYVHKTKPISKILKEFKTTKTHIAVVFDEYGGTLGIITLEDILEELVGDIWDETDVVEKEVLEEDGSFVIDGNMNIYDMLDQFQEDDSDFDSEYTSVAGWCTEMLEKFPEVNDEFFYKNLKITILEVDKVRVEKIKVEKIIEEEDL